MDLTDIKQKAEEFFEWPSDKRESVYYTSAMLFAWHCVKDAEDAIRAERDALAAEVVRLREERDEFKESYRLAMVSVNDAYDKGKEAATAQLATERERGRAEMREMAAKCLELRANEIKPWASAGHDFRRAELFMAAKELRALPTKEEK